MMVQISIKEVQNDGQVDVHMTEVVSGTFPSKLAAAMLRALADEWDPKHPVMRGAEPTSGGTP